jgi:hypothetical protein
MALYIGHVSGSNANKKRKVSNKVMNFISPVENTDQGWANSDV